jgi:hypothetical protein
MGERKLQRCNTARSSAQLMTGGLPAIDVERLSRHEAGRLQIENDVDDIGYLARVADRMHGTESR